jgi:signal transduction histidine kinase
MSSDYNSVRIHDYSRTSDHAAESTKNVARDIRESSSTMKQLIHTLVRTGAFEEIARTILETTIAIRDTANEINEIVKDVKERGTIKDTASAVVETTNATRNTIEIAKAAIETDSTKRSKQRRLP